MKTAIEIKDMTKTFGPTIALNSVNFTALSGEIHGLIGENGSGKSTVSSIFAGMQKADSGEMFFEGEQWCPSSMNDALKKGVGMIVQESGTIPGVSVAENIYPGETKEFARYGLVDRKRMINSAQNVLDRIGAGHIKASSPTFTLDFQDRKIVEIAHVMAKNPRILIVDETTTALSQNGRDIIYRIMNEFKNDGKAVLFISHDLDEIMDKCDHLTVLRDGNIIRTFDKSKGEFEPDAIKTSMIGRELSGNYYRVDFNEPVTTEIVLKADHINFGNELQDMSLELFKGEILGIGGLSHCGMHTLGKIIFGNISPDFGTVTVLDNVVTDERSAMKLGIGYVAKDRDVESLCLDASIRDNIAIAGTDKFGRHGILTKALEKKYVEKQTNNFQVKCTSIDQPVSALSGGNKQKVVFGKWSGRDSEILILDCPTRGVDIGVKQAMYQFMYEMKLKGKSILLISEEMSELIGMSDRLLIMKDGCLQKEFKRSRELTDADVIEYMI